MKKLFYIYVITMIIALVLSISYIILSPVMVNRLELFANQLQVSVIYVDTQTMIDNKNEYVLHCIPAGLYFPSSHNIYIDKAYGHEPYFLAHELGHYISHMLNNDLSEESADLWSVILRCYVL